MGRSKTEFIHNAKTRQRTFQKKKDGIIKQAYQLQTLCDVDVSIITFSPKIDERLQPQPPEIWPPESNKFLSQIEAFGRQSPEEKKKRTTELENYLEEKCRNHEEEIAKQRKKNCPSWNLNYNDLPEEKLLQIVSDLDSKIQFINGKLGYYGSQPDHHQSHTATDLPNIESQSLFEQPANQFDNDFTYDFSTVFPNLMMTGGDDGFEWTDFSSNDNNHTKYGYGEQQIGHYSGLVQQISTIMMQYQCPSNPMPPLPHMDPKASLMQYQDPTTLLPPLPPIIQYQCPATRMTVMPQNLERRFP